MSFTSVSNCGLNRMMGELPARNTDSVQTTTAKKINDISPSKLEAAPVPRTGGAGGCLAGSAAGFVAGLLITACATVEVWGTGTGLWVEGEKANCDGCVLAGRILVLYITPSLVGIGALIGSCYGACGGFKASSD